MIYVTNPNFNILPWLLKDQMLRYLMSYPNFFSDISKVQGKKFFFDNFFSIGQGPSNAGKLNWNLLDFFSFHIHFRTMCLLWTLSVRHYKVCRKKKLALNNAYRMTFTTYSQCLVHRVHSKMDTFLFEHIPKRTHSILSTFQKGHIPVWAHSNKSTFQIMHILFWSHSKKGTFLKEHIPNKAHSKNAHSKKAHSKKAHPKKAHFILSTFQKGIEINP